MRNERIAAARDVAAKLLAAEAAIDEAFARVAQLNMALPEARRMANLSAVVGQEAFPAPPPACSIWLPRVRTWSKRITVCSRRRPISVCAQ